MSRNRRRPLPAPTRAVIESLDQEGRGVAHVDGKAVFVSGALPGETVVIRYRQSKRRYDEAEAVEVLDASPDRVEPPCPHFGLCGGCSLQHMAPAAQIHHKQLVLEQSLKRIGGVQPSQWLAPLTGPVLGYRRKARLGVKHVPKKGGVLVGFREKGSPYIADLSRCLVLDAAVGERLLALRGLVESLSICDRVPQIEVSLADEGQALVFRHLEPLSASDLQALATFGESGGFQIYLQPGGPDTVHLLYPSQASLGYSLDEFQVTLHMQPTDFTQVNAEINRRMVSRALELLQPGPADRVLDLFCGLGNFTLPLARRAAQVTGVEGEAELVQRARDNASRNGIVNARFYTSDLAADLSAEPWLAEKFDKILLDPPRTGAMEVIPLLKRTGASRILYVSCNPATLARDAGILVKEMGFRLLQAGVMDMFPHTAHVESIALFEV